MPHIRAMSAICHPWPARIVAPGRVWSAASSGSHVSTFFLCLHAVDVIWPPLSGFEAEIGIRQYTLSEMDPHINHHLPSLQGIVSLN